MHHFNEALLAACFHELDGSKAVGIDEVTKAQYGEHLDANRLAKYHFQLNEQKTRLVTFSKQSQWRGDLPGVFDFLGFTFYWGRSRRGTMIPKLKTAAAYATKARAKAADMKIKLWES